MLFAIILYEFFVLHALKTTAVIKHEENRISSASYIPSFASPREVDDVVICLLILRVCACVCLENIHILTLFNIMHFIVKTNNNNRDAHQQ